jgi:hypothetical protein
MSSLRYDELPLAAEVLGMTVSRHNQKGNPVSINESPGGIQIFTVPTNSQFYYYVFQFY